MDKRFSDLNYSFQQLRIDQDYINVAKRIWVAVSNKKTKKVFQVEEAKSLLIYLALDLLNPGEASDIILCSWGLLKGYEYGKDLTARRLFYLEDRERYVPDYINKQPFASMTKKQKEQRADAQYRKENALYNKLLESFYSVENKCDYLAGGIAAFIDNGIKKSTGDPVIYPIPSYIKNAQRKVIPVSNIHSAEAFGLPLANDWFCGRADNLKVIEKNFKKGSHIQIICGMGGMGKTQTALKFAYDRLDSYSLIHWVDGHDLESIVEDYTSFLKAKDIMPKNVSMENICHNYTEYMSSHSDWLIIYDNCDYYTDDEFNTFKNLCLPKSFSRGNILITSRNNRKIGASEIIDIHTLSEEDSVQFLLKRTETDDRPMAERLAKRLGCFPLAMEIAGAYIYATPGCNIEKYLSYLYESSGILDKLVDVTDYNNTIKEVILLTLERIKKDISDSDLANNVETFLFLSAHGDPQELSFNLFFLVPTDFSIFPEQSEMKEIYDSLRNNEK